jgi:hypothetical protein
MSVGSLVIYAFGLPWLFAWGETNPHLSGIDDMTVAQTLKWGLLPFIPGDIAKLLLAAGLVPAGWQLLRWLRLGRTEQREVPTGMRLAPLGLAAGLAIAVGAILPWSAGVLGIEQAAGVIVLASGLVGATSNMLLLRHGISAQLAHLLAFTAGAVGAVLGFVRLVEFTATGEFGIAPIGIGVPVVMVFSLVLLAATASETAAE